MDLLITSETLYQLSYGGGFTGSESQTYERKGALRKMGMRVVTKWIVDEPGRLHGFPENFSLLHHELYEA